MILPKGAAWLILIASGCCECGWAIGLRYVDGFAKPLALVFVVTMLGASFGGLTLALRSLPVGTAYAVWTGIGAAGTATLGIALFAEPAGALRLASLALIVCGIVGVSLAS